MTLGVTLTFLGVVLIATTGAAGWVGLAAAVGVALAGLGLLLRVIVSSTSERADPDAAPSPR